jgi:hypothetical protein
MNLHTINHTRHPGWQIPAKHSFANRSPRISRRLPLSRPWSILQPPQADPFASEHGPAAALTTDHPHWRM